MAQKERLLKRLLNAMEEGDRIHTKDLTLAGGATQERSTGNEVKILQQALNLFPSVTFENSPQEVEIKLIEK